ncbi:nucleoside phosphorylase [Flavivirga spongiicola]|uniref:Uridine phosphorylase n=1 Tax=Flavivirga spongiicola TaxID=421621 RepID=A0ABU7XMG7_9FLAO|nr:nucleoside phosphorylase [Flavivirga sp. MEBiC05379]MDO5981394.1 nucleoside phosphorylase [Flavivirga sp. MEBiC05379]
MILDSELILNPDGSIFHLHLKPGQVADTVILVGDPNRVNIIESFLSNVEVKVSNREYVCVTGMYNNTRITVVSTGVGIGNIDIVMNELDALVNIDFEKRKIKDTLKTLNFIRIGTSGSLQKDIPVNSFVISQKSIGFDNLLCFYDKHETIENKEFKTAFKSHLGASNLFFSPYVIDASKTLFNKLNSSKTFSGITITSPGFYVPQGRELRLKAKLENINEKLSSFKYNDFRIANYEMESSAMYGLSKLLNHKALAICLIIANRLNKNANENYREQVKELISYVLNKITNE